MFQNLFSKNKTTCNPDKALKEAHESLRLIKMKQPEINRIISISKNTRERNHFQEQLSIIMKGGRT